MSESTDDFLSAEVAENVAAASGRFTILRPYASGGLGQVFIARDNEFGRDVALKQIKPEFADGNYRDRFVLEAQVTGLLEHPGIVPVYSLGQFSDGRPFYAMRFIRGDSLRDAILRFHAPPSPPANRSAFSTATEVVTVDPNRLAYDVPPTLPSPAESIVRVAVESIEGAGENARPTRVDFSSLEFRSLLRRFIDVCNAVAYAHSRNVLHRDIKPANVMLGEFGETLVVDWGLAKTLGNQEESAANRLESAATTLPFAHGDAASSGELTEPGSTIGTPAYMSPEQAAGKTGELGPASDVYSLGATLFTILTGKPPFQGATVFDIISRVQVGGFPRPAEMTPNVPKPLEAICLKAMSTAPNNRYADALALAAEIERWLADEPVAAWRAPWNLRARRWMRRHPGIVAGMAAAVLVSLVGIVAGLAVVGAKNRQLVAEKSRTENEFRRAKQAIDEYFIAVAESEELTEKFPGMHEFRLKLLDKARLYYESFVEEHAANADLQSDAATAYYNRAVVANDMGQSSDAARNYQAALAIRERLARENPNDDALAGELAGTLSNLALAQAKLGQFALALDRQRAALAIRERLAAAHPESPELAARVAESNINIGFVLQKTNDLAAATSSYQTGLAIFERLHREHPDSIKYAAELAKLHNNLANVRRLAGKAKEAHAGFQAALDLRRSIAKAQPNSARSAAELAASLFNVGLSHADLRQAPESIANLRAALEIRQRLADANAAVPEYAADLARCRKQLGSVHQTAGQSEEALAHYRAAEVVLAKLVANHPDIAEYAADLAGTHNNLANLERRLGKLEDASRDYDRAIATLRNLAAKFPTVPVHAANLGRALSNVGVMQASLGQTTKARESYRESLAIKEKLARSNPGMPSYAADLVATYGNLGNLERDTGSVDASLDWYGKSIAILSPLEKFGANGKAALLSTHYNRAIALEKLGRFDEALADLNAAARLDGGAAQKQLDAARRSIEAKRAAKSR